MNDSNAPVNLQYQFSLEFVENQTELLLHPWLLSNPYLTDVILPFGAFWIKVTTINTTHSSTTTTPVHFCNITVSTLGTTGANVNGAPRLHVTGTFTNYANLLQNVQTTILFYGQNTASDNSTNTYNIGLELLEFLTDNFGSNNADFCHTSYVAQLGQVLKLWVEYFGNVCKLKP